MKQTDLINYADEFKDYLLCIFCDMPTLIKTTTPRGKSKLKKQDYLLCTNCNKLQVLLKEHYLTGDKE